MMKTKFGLNNIKESSDDLSKQILELSNEFLISAKDLKNISKSDKRIVILSGRCPSKKINLIHLRFFDFLFRLQKLLDAELLIPISSEEVFLRKRNLSFKDIEEISYYNMKVIKELIIGK